MSDSYFENKEYLIPKHVSYRTFFAETRKSKSFILNSKTSSFVSLSGLSSDLWDIISQNKTYSSLYDWATKKRCLESLKSFLSKLENLGLIVLKENKKQEKQHQEKEEKIVILNKNSNIGQPEIEHWYDKSGFLYSLFIELSYKCNLNCIHCYNQKDYYDELSFAQVKKIIDEAYEIGIFEVTLSGGECTLAKDFLKIAKYVKSKHLVLNIITNGQKINDDEEFRKEIIKIVPDRVGISLYSMKPETHNDITQIDGSFHKTLNTIKILKKENINLQIKTFLMNKNADEYEKIIAFAGANNIPIQFDTQMLPQWENDIRHLLQCSEEQLKKLYTDFRSPLYIKKFDFKSKKHKNDWLCKGGVSFLSVSPAYKLSPCSSMKNFSEDLSNNSIIKIWNNRDIAGSLSKWRRTIKYKNIKCNKKKYCKFCLLCSKVVSSGSGVVNFLEKNDTYANGQNEQCLMAQIKEYAFNKVKDVKKVL